MAPVLLAEVRVFLDAWALSRAAAGALADLVRDAARRQRRFALALAGGETPRTLYTVLASEYAGLPWQAVHFFWGDERFVPPDHPQSNYCLAHETLLGRIPIPAENVHPIPTDRSSPKRAAAEYRDFLRAWFGTELPRFDLVLLGLGVDGHTASLFPGSPLLRARRRPVAETTEASGRGRVTLTLPAINNAARVWFMVSGRTKACALARTLARRGRVVESPARGVRPTHGELVFWADLPAVVLLGESSRCHVRAFLS